jgi:hypothetical protein
VLTLRAQESAHLLVNGYFGLLLYVSLCFVCSLPVTVLQTVPRLILQLLYAWVPTSECLTTTIRSALLFVASMTLSTLMVFIGRIIDRVSVASACSNFSLRWWSPSWESTT